MGAPHAPAPQTPYQAGMFTSNIAKSLENSLPSYLNISQNPLFDPSSPQAQGYISNYANDFYKQSIGPAVGQLQTDQYQNGEINSSGGGAQLGQMAAEGAIMSRLQGINAYESLLGGLNNTSSGYFQGPGQLALGALGSSNQYQNQRYATQGQIYGSQLGALSSPISGLASGYGKYLGGK